MGNARIVRYSARKRKLRERQSRDQRVDNRNPSRRRNQDAENNRKYVGILDINFKNF